MEPHNDFQSPAAGWLRTMGIGLRHAEHPLSRIPILLGVALGLGLGLTRFILAVREDLLASPQFKCDAVPGGHGWLCRAADCIVQCGCWVLHWGIARDGLWLVVHQERGRAH